MFREIILPIFRSTRLCATVCGTNHPRCCRPPATGLWARAACSFRSAQAATLLEFMYHSQIVLSVGGSVWYMIRNLRRTVTIDTTQFGQIPRHGTLSYSL